MKSKAAAYLLWLLCIFSLCGVQRIYCKRYISGIIYFFTFGVFGIGQIIDLFVIPDMVDEENLKYKALYGYNPQFLNQVTSQVVSNPRNQVAPMPNSTKSQKVSDTIKILKLAKNNGGIVSLVDCMLETGKEAEEVKKTLEKMCRDDLLEITNLPDSGAIVYKLL